MTVSGIRRLARRGGVFGLAAAALYIAIRTRTAFMAILGTLVIGLALWFRAPEPVYIITNDPQTPIYDLVDLGTHGQGVAVTALNNQGNAAGVVLLDEDTVHAAVWIDGRMKDIGTLRGALSIATDINDRGEVVGLSEAGRESFFGFRWREGRMSPLPSLNKKWSAASAINQRGKIAGVSTSDSAPLVACGWEGGKAHSLPMPRGFGASFAEDLNGRGAVIGFAIEDSGERARAVQWEGRHATVLSTLGGKSSVAVCIAEMDVIGGASNVRGESEKNWNAVMWQDGRIRDLGRLSDAQWAVVNGINRRGEMVGASGRGCGSSQAVVWANGRIRDLNRLIKEPGWSLLNASAINDKGHIAGTAVHNDQLHGFLLSPRATGSDTPYEYYATSYNMYRVPKHPHQPLLCWMTGGIPKESFDQLAFPIRLEAPHR